MTLGGGPSGIQDVSPTCIRNNPTGWGFGGTSSSAPVVSGIGALLKSLRPSLLGEDIANLLNYYAAHPGVPEMRDNLIGYGPVNAAAALGAVVPSRTVAQLKVGKGAPWPLVEQESLQVTQAFDNVPGLFGNRLYTAWRHRLRGVANYNYGFTTIPLLWTRASGTWGWRDTTGADSIMNYNDEVRSGKLVGPRVPPNWTPGTAISDTFETSIYRVVNPDSPSDGVWFPCPPGDAAVAFTAIGPATTVGVEAPNLEGLFTLRTYPNPVSRQVFVDLELPGPGTLRVSVLDILGRRVAHLADGEAPAGSQRLRWNGRGQNGEPVASGAYFLQVYYDGRSTVRRFVLLSSGR